MSVKHLARTTLNRMNLRPALLAPQFTTLAADLRELADADESLEQAHYEKRRDDMARAYGYQRAETDKPFVFSNGVAIIPVHGTLINRFNWSYGFLTGYNFIRAQFQAAMADDDVQMIVFDCNSFGGEVSGCFELADEIFAGRTEKPSLALVDSAAYSACYALASSASKVVVTPSSGVGSVGVVAMHVNVGEFYKSMGIEITFIHSGAHKVDGNPYEALSEDVRADIQASVDKTREKFAASVARGRNLTAKVVKDTEARTYDADDALALGFIDAVQMPSEAVQAFFNELSGSGNSQEQQMTTPQNKGPEAASAPDVQAAVAAERTRMSSIMGCDEAKGKTKLANHLAFSSTMSLDEAKATLAAASPEVAQTVAAPDAAAVAAAAAAATAAQANAGDLTFKEHMNKDKQPEVGAGGAGGEDQKQSASQRILAAQAAATGYKAKTGARAE